MSEHPHWGAWADRLSIRWQRDEKRRRIARMVMSDVLSFGHAHVIGPDGHWCATLAPVDLVSAGALLYVKFPDPPTGVSTSLVIYDEAALFDE